VARTAPNGLQFPHSVPFEAWVAIGRRIGGISNSSAWWLGDWLVYGQRAYGKRYKLALEATSLDYQTLRNYAWVARRFELSRRRDGLSFQHHAEVATLSEPRQDLWLGRAERLRWSRNELRRRLAAERRLTRGAEDAQVTCRIDVAAGCEQRWREAAEACERPFREWVVSALTAAADAALRDSGRESPDSSVIDLVPSRRR
jgi:hypothetical protein